MQLGKTSDLLQAGEQLEIVARDIAIGAFTGAVARNGTVSFVVPAIEQRVTLGRVWESAELWSASTRCGAPWSRCS